jgi:hypothetical protein
MTLRELLDVLTHEEKVALAEKAETTYIYLFQMAAGARSPSPKLARKLAAADSRLKLADLRPDIWGRQTTH